jgi:uncharacterized membrane protein
MLDSKLYFRRHIDVVHSQAHTTLGLIHYVTYVFSLDCLVVLYNSLSRSELQQYASVIWNNLSLIDSNKI